jgi:transposase
MSQKTVSMDKVQQITRLFKEGVPIKEIVRRLSISRNSVKKYVKRLHDNPDAKDVVLSPEIAYGSLQAEDARRRYEDLLQYFFKASCDLGRPGVTREVLWGEYMLLHANGYSYSQFCHHLKRYERNSDLAMHLEYKPGDLTMFDHAGKRMSIVSRDTGEVIPCECFVAILPFSGLIFATFTPSKKTTDLVTGLNGMILYFGGVTASLLGDNAKSLVAMVDRYEPRFTELCRQLGEHYQTVLTATRPYSPRDKGMVEGAVKIVYSAIYAPLRNRMFESVEQLNAAAKPLLEALNDRPYRNTPFGRRYFFEKDERPTLKALPSEPFTPRMVCRQTVQRNYHIQLFDDNRYYSVPFIHVGKQVMVLYDAKTVEVYLDNARIAFHDRKEVRKSYATIVEHMPPHHQRMLEVKGWTRDGLLSQADAIGPSTRLVAARILEKGAVVEQNYKACHGMLMLAKKFDAKRLEAACNRLKDASSASYSMVKRILNAGLDRMQTDEIPEAPLPVHENIRGGNEYQ